MEDLSITAGENKKDLLKNLQWAHQKKKITLVLPKTEETLRFLLEKTPVDLVLGAEKIHPHDSLYYPRGGVDQIICKIAKEKNKTLAFSFSELLNASASERPKLLRRMKFTLSICQKYQVKVFFSNFSAQKEDMRSALDLFVFWKLLGGVNREELSFYSK